MSNNPFNFKDKRDRNDFFIAIPVILFFGWLFYCFGFQPSGVDLVSDELVANVSTDMGDTDNDGVLNSNDKCPYEPGLASANGCPHDTDGDGVNDYYDRCPNTSGNLSRQGCPELVGKDIDGDGFVGKEDLCPDIAGTDAGCPADADKDGIPNSEDKCPQQRGPAENNGCPPDADRDGVPDGSDKCPKVAGVAGNAGCPADTDKDGIYDKDDRCPKIAGVKANSGCPSDRDRDGVYDKDDKCPNQRGVASNNGCPVKAAVADKDGDGVVDAKDKCPNRAGPASRNGCPEIKMTAAEKKVITEAVNNVVFLTSSPNLTEYSKGLVAKIATLMKKYPDAKLKISGHTDSSGNDASNLALSKGRAATCLNFLVQKGIAKGRMSSAGFGETKPIAPNNTAEGRKKNRRVEFELFY